MSTIYYGLSVMQDRAHRGVLMPTGEQRRYCTQRVDNARTLVDVHGTPLANQITWEVVDRQTGFAVAIFDIRKKAWACARHMNAEGVLHE
jgi:hypothetical protein